MDVAQWSGWIPNRANVRLGVAGVVKMYADRRFLYLDVDRPSPVTIRSVFRVLRSVGLRASYCRYDRTERGWHVIVRLNKPIEPLATVAIQVIMGSDPKRERFNLVRAMSGKANRNRRWNMLFEYKI